MQVCSRLVLVAVFQVNRSYPVLLDIILFAHLLVGWQEGHPACKKTEQWAAGMVICLERDADFHMADATATYCLLLQ